MSTSSSIATQVSPEETLFGTSAPKPGDKICNESPPRHPILVPSRVLLRFWVGCFYKEFVEFFQRAEFFLSAEFFRSAELFRIAEFCRIPEFGRIQEFRRIQPNSPEFSRVPEFCRIAEFGRIQHFGEIRRLNRIQQSCRIRRNSQRGVSEQEAGETLRRIRQIRQNC